MRKSDGATAHVQVSGHAAETLRSHADRLSRSVAEVTRRASDQVRISQGAQISSERSEKIIADLAPKDAKQ